MAGKIGMYLRLSDEDENAEESNSIKGQRELIYDFILKDDVLSTYEISEFCDDGYSGTDFNRPAVTEILLQGENGAISCIIVKDFSRFGRNYIEVGSYIEQVFPFWGIRFISINDNFDSSKFCNSEFMGTAFKNILNDFYSKDLSGKITSVRRSKAEQGRFITAFAPYGYQKTGEQKLVIDEVAAPVVQRVFAMAMEGIPKVQIARVLNEEKVPSPFMFRKMRKEHLNCSCVNEKQLWFSSTISNILKDQRYVGDGVYGKVKPTRVGSGVDKAVPKKEWVVVSNAHEAIISREIFEKVSARFKSYKERKNAPQYPLSKKVRCGACNHMISRKTSGSKERETLTATYRCATLDVTDEFGCYGARVDERQIEEAVLFYLNRMLASIYDYNFEKNFIDKLNEGIHKSQTFIKQQEKELKKINLTIVQLYEMYKKNKIDKDEFLKKKYEYKNIYQQMQATLMLEQEKSDILCSKLGSKSDDCYNKFHPFQSLTRELVEAFVDVIIIEKNGAVKIYWKFQDLFQE